MHRNTLTIFSAAVLAVAIAGPSRAAAPQETKKEQTKQEAAKNDTFYRVDYAIHEVENGKRTNTRNYTLKVREGDRSSFRVGSRIPVAFASGQAVSNFNYQNVGVNIDSTVKIGDAGLSLNTRMGMSSVADSAATNHGTPPVLRSLDLEDNSLVEPGKPTLIGAIDDAASDRRYEIEATVTKLK